MKPEQMALLERASAEHTAAHATPVDRPAPTFRSHPMDNLSLHQRRQAATPRGVGVMCSFFADRARNAELWDVEGRRVIDFAAGIAVVNTGHRHPKVVQAIAAQLERFTHTAYQIVPYASYVELAERI